MDLLEKMATFVRVVEAGSLSAAAKQLRVSPAAVSRQITTLEAEVKVPLLLRSTRRMAITEAGRGYYERCLRILRDVDDAQRIGGGDGVEGLLKVNAPVTFGTLRVVPHLDTLLKKHPRLRVELRLEDRLVDVVLDGVDMTIRAGGEAPDNASLVAHGLASYPRVLVAAPAYLKKAGIPKSPEALAKHATLSHITREGAHTWSLRSAERDVVVTVSPTMTTNSFQALGELVGTGLGIALLPNWLVESDIARGRLRPVLPEWQTPPIVVRALHRVEQRGVKRIRALIDHLREAYDRVG